MYKNIKRYIYNDNRKQSVYEINSIINDATITISHLLNSKNIIPDTSTIDRNYTLEIIEMLLNELSFAINGIHNLKFTYKSDENIVSQIDIILLKINSLIKNTNFKLETINENIETDL